MLRLLEPRNRLCLHRIAWPRKPTPRIKQRVTSYHTTEVIARQKAKRGCLVTIVRTKPVNSNFSPKIGCHGNVPQHLWTPIQYMIPTAHPSPQPKRHPYRFSRLCTNNRRVSLYFTMGRPFSPKICPFAWGDLDPHLIHGSPGQPKSSTQKAARSV